MKQGIKIFLAMNFLALPSFGMNLANILPKTKLAPQIQALLAPGNPVTCEINASFSKGDQDKALADINAKRADVEAKSKELDAAVAAYMAKCTPPANTSGNKSKKSR
jgi:hypothetical protein